MRSVFLALMSFIFACGAAQGDQPVHFVDPHLREAVESELWITDPTPADMEGLTRLNCWKHEVGDLTGLEYATHLEDLVCTYGGLRDLTPISGLVHLQRLVVSNNAISDMSPLSGLSNLRYLDIHDNHIDNISSLSGCSALETLIIRSNPIGDISVLSGLVHLQDAILLETGICDLSPLTGLTSLTHLDVRMNPLNREACAAHIPQILANNPGVNIEYDPCVQYHVTLSSTDGGAIVEPGEGDFTYDNADSVLLVAQAEPGFIFTGFSGTHMSLDNPTLLMVEQNHQIQANFLRVRNTLYVDDDAAEDPGPGAAQVGRPAPSGTSDCPFDRIQDALDVAAEGTLVLVRPGTYRESLRFPARNIELKSESLYDRAAKEWPVLEGVAGQPIVSFTDDPGKDGLLAGFVLAGGQAPLAAAIYCAGGKATIENCLIVGNRATEANGAIIYGEQSQVTLTHCTMADNLVGPSGAGLLLIDSNAVVTNSILWGDGPREVLCRGVGEAFISYCDILGVWPGVGNLTADPLFASAGRWVDGGDPAAKVTFDNPHAVWVMGDYHVQSQSGRWNSETGSWLRDERTSPCVDAGDPDTPIHQEPFPNGGTVNLGAYGGTTHASKS